MRIRHDLQYDAPPADVRAMLSDPAFREKVCEATHALRREVRVDGAGPGAGMSVLVDQTQAADGIPSFAKKLLGDEIRIVRREDWSGPQDAALAVEIPGRPAGFQGRLVLAADGTGTVESVTGEVRVRVPMVGAKLESLVADVLVAALRSEERVGRRWLAGSG
jgi:hypothetical protein